MENITLFNNKFRMLMLAFLGLALMLIMAPKASAATYDISPSCTLNQAFEAINTPAAVGSCPAGEATNTINIPADSNPYVLTADLQITNGSSLTMTGAGVGQTTIDGDTNGYSIRLTTASTSSYVLQGFTLKRSGMQIAAQDSAVVNATIQNIQATDCASKCLQIDNGNFETPTSALVTANITSLIANGSNCSTGQCLLINTNSSNAELNDTTVNIKYSSFFENSVSGENPFKAVMGFFNIGGRTTAQLTNNTIANNTTIGAIITGDVDPNEGTPPASIRLDNNTIASNSAGIINPPDFGDIYTKVEYYLTNNILSNTGSNCPTVPPTVISEGGNVSSDTSCNGVFIDPTDQNNTNPQLGSLTLENGTYVMPITQSSPAYNKGVDGKGTPTDDQRGITRPQFGLYDSGAYEVNTSSPTPSNNGSLASTGNDARVPLALAIVLVSIGAAGSVVALKRR